jgi:hypothetical protein
MVVLDTNGNLLYIKEFRNVSNNIYISLHNDQSYIVFNLFVTPFTVNNYDNNGTITSTETYTSTSTGDIDNVYIYGIIAKKSPDPYSLGTTINGNDNFSPYNGGKNPVKSAMLILNGLDRFAERKGDYFNLMQCYKHHTCIPKSRGINVYSFALYPEELQPSGTCNFSRIDSSRLRLQYIPESTGGTMLLYAVNYNILRIMSGMGGVLYSN